MEKRERLPIVKRESGDNDKSWISGKLREMADDVDKHNGVALVIATYVLLPNSPDDLSKDVNVNACSVDGFGGDISGYSTDQLTGCVFNTLDTLNRIIMGKFTESSLPVN